MLACLELLVPEELLEVRDRLDPKGVPRNVEANQGERGPPLAPDTRAEQHRGRVGMQGRHGQQRHKGPGGRGREEAQQLGRECAGTKGRRGRAPVGNKPPTAPGRQEAGSPGSGQPRLPVPSEKGPEAPVLPKGYHSVVEEPPQAH